MRKELTVLILIIFCLSGFISISAEEEEFGMGDIQIFTQEDFEEKVDTTKVEEIDYTMLDETYTVFTQNKDIEKAENDRIKLWITQLSDPNENIKKDAILVLGKIRHIAAVPDLLKIMQNPVEKQDIRLSAAWSLGRMGYEVLKDLEPLLESKDLKTRIYAVWAIGVSRSKAAIPIIKKVRKNADPKDKVFFQSVLNTMKLFDTSLLNEKSWIGY